MRAEATPTAISQDLYRPLGKSGLRVSPVGTGTNRWSMGTNEESVWQTFRALVEAGVNFFDTAEVYQQGRSESLLGACMERLRALRERAPAERTRVVVASKFRPYPERVSLEQFMDALDGSLSRLGLRTLDLYYIHTEPTSVSVETTMDWMAEAVEQGKVRTVGVSNFSAGEMRRAAARLDRYGIPLAVNQVEYSLFDREPEANGVLDTCREMNVALVAYKPLGRGMLHPESGGDPRLLETLRRIAETHEKTVNQVALNWLLGKGDFVIPIPGTTNARHALENLGASGWEITEEERAEIDRTAG